ncbi:MAG: transcriptional regulator with XRE-family HTH domain [Paraglaciecola sp.]|jgi:transcriptional regulator with XRE-family HTH domain
MKMQINAKKIKQIREQRCWSQLQLSEMAGISLRTLQRVEAKSVASQETIKSIAAVMEIDCELLLPDASEPTPLTREQLEQATLADERARNTDVDIVHSAMRRQLIVTLVVILLSSAIGFAGVYFAYSENRIDNEQFGLFKDLVSGGFLIGLAGLTYRAYKTGFISLSKFY